MERTEQFIRKLRDNSLEPPVEITGKVVDLFFSLNYNSSSREIALFQKLADYCIPVPDSQTNFVMHRFHKNSLRKSATLNSIRKTAVVSIY